MKRQVKVASPEESGRIVTHENMYFFNGTYERRSSKLADENAKVVFERSYSYLRFKSPSYSKIAQTITSKLERLDCSHLLNSENRSKLSTDYSSSER